MAYKDKFDKVFEKLWPVYNGSMSKKELKQQIRDTATERGEKASDITMDGPAPLFIPYSGCSCTQPRHITSLPSYGRLRNRRTGISGLNFPSTAKWC